MLNEAFIVFLNFYIVMPSRCWCAKDNEGEKLEYNGRALIIGVVGEKPKDTFRNVKFEQMKLEELKRKSKEVDGFLIMKEYFQEASKEQRFIFIVKETSVFIGLQDKSYSIFITKI